MNIGITKKLIDKLKIKVDKGDETSDIFSWSVNLITLNRKNTVVVVNDYSRYGFVLYGLKIKEFNNLDKLIIDGIKKSLKSLQIREDIINKYLELAGELVYTKTNGPRYVSRLNKACERTYYFEELLDLNNIYQSDVSKKMNWDMITFNNEYAEPTKLLIEALKGLFNEEIIQCEAAELEITLDLGVYKAIRNITLPINISFHDLNRVIQRLYSWHNCHLHDFLIYDSSGECILDLISEDEEDEGFSQTPIKYQSEVMITDFIKEKYKIEYRYDYGDGWIHEIKVNKIIEKYTDYNPVCTYAVGDAPPENVGGIPGYINFYKIINDKEHPEYQEYYKWARGNGYREVDIKMINIGLDFVI